ncbi:nitroreductase family protein [[Eubacterium] cellulosolvens]
MNSNLFDLVKKRKTTRIFDSREVNPEDLFYCIKVAVQAPSGANRQPWRFMIIDDPLLRKELRKKCEEQEKIFHENVKAELKEWFRSKEIMWRKPHLTSAPSLLAIFSDQDMIYATESTWLAIGYILIAIEEKSLSTVTYTPPQPEGLRELFNTPENFNLETILPIGYSADPKQKEERQLTEMLICRNRWKKISKNVS